MAALSCKTCAKPNAVTCLACGHAFCSLHRGDLDGIATCADCLKEANERKQRAIERKRKFAERTKAAEARRTGGARAETDDTDESPRPRPPLPEPAGNGPLLWGLKAALPTAIYFWVFLGWLASSQDLGTWIRPAGTVAFAAVAFAGVWAIAKTRASSPPGPGGS